MSFDEETFVTVLKGFKELKDLAKEETFECAFVALLRKSDNVVEVPKMTMVQFIQDCSRSAMNLTATGMAFPSEEELLMELSESEEEDGYSDRDDFEDN